VKKLVLVTNGLIQVQPLLKSSNNIFAKEIYTMPDANNGAPERLTAFQARTFPTGFTTIMDRNYS
jgi:hypothetical protein